VWSTPTDVTVNIFVDRDMNGTDDFQIVTTAPADAASNLLDVFVSARRPSPFTGGLALDSFINNINGAALNTVVFNTNVMAVPVFAQAIGLTTANAKFKYRVSTTSRGFGGTIDSTGYKTYDAANPGFNLTGGVAGLTLYTDLPGASIPVQYNKANVTANGSLGVLLMHHHNGASAHAETLSVQEPSATAVAVAAVAGQYSDPVTLKATVSPSSYLDQTVSGNLQFSVDGNPIGGAVAVGAGGVATTSYTIVNGAGPHSITAAFTSANSAFLNSNGAGTLTVTQENASVDASSANAGAVQVSSPGGSASSVNLCFQINELADGSAGNTANVTSATLVLAPIGGGPSITTSTATFTGGGVGATRNACFNLATVAVNVYDVTMTINGIYYTGGGTTILTVYDPSLGMVTGGGTIIRNGVKANFGVNIKYQKNGNAQGQVLYMEHRATGVVKLKSNAMGDMAIVGVDANATGKATLNGVGNHAFIARIIDNGEPGTNDRFGLRVTDPNGNIVVDMTFDPVQLEGGNVQVPQGNR
jgi:hypothetical protein